MLSHLGVSLPKRIRECSLLGGSMPLRVGCEVSEAKVRTLCSLPFLLLVDPDVELLATLNSLQHCVCLHSAMLPTIMLTD